MFVSDALWTLRICTYSILCGEFVEVVHISSQLCACVRPSQYNVIKANGLQLDMLCISLVFLWWHMPSMLWRCWLGGRKGIRPVKNWVVRCWCGFCLEQGADLHVAQLMPLPLTVSCLSKIQIGFTFLVPAHPRSPGKRAVKWVCVCVFYDWHDACVLQYNYSFALEKCAVRRHWCMSSYLQHLVFICIYLLSYPATEWTLDFDRVLFVCCNI